MYAEVLRSPAEVGLLTRCLILQSWSTPLTQTTKLLCARARRGKVSISATPFTGSAQRDHTTSVSSNPGVLTPKQGRCQQPLVITVQKILCASTTLRSDRVPVQVAKVSSAHRVRCHLMQRPPEADALRLVYVVLTAGGVLVGARRTVCL
jgi:hypothetical protein